MPLHSYGLKSAVNNTFHLHCAISTQTETAIAIPVEQVQDLTGFDRLREIGFSEEDVREARRYFYSVRRAQLQGTESRSELLQLEEEFLGSIPEGQRPQQQQQTEEGTYYDLIGGMLMGFLLGFLMLLVLFEDIQMKGKRKCGILVGIGCNLSFCLLKLIVL